MGSLIKAEREDILRTSVAIALQILTKCGLKETTLVSLREECNDLIKPDIVSQVRFNDDSIAQLNALFEEGEQPQAIEEHSEPPDVPMSKSADVEEESEVKHDDVDEDRMDDDSTTGIRDDAEENTEDAPKKMTDDVSPAAEAESSPQPEAKDTPKGGDVLAGILHDEDDFDEVDFGGDSDDEPAAIDEDKDKSTDRPERVISGIPTDAEKQDADKKRPGKTPDQVSKGKTSDDSEPRRVPEAKWETVPSRRDRDRRPPPREQDKDKRKEPVREKRDVPVAEKRGSERRRSPERRRSSPARGGARPATRPVDGRRRSRSPRVAHSTERRRSPVGARPRSPRLHSSSTRKPESNDRRSDLPKSDRPGDRQSDRHRWSRPDVSKSSELAKPSAFSSSKDASKDASKDLSRPSARHSPSQRDLAARDLGARDPGAQDPPLDGSASRKAPPPPRPPPPPGPPHGSRSPHTLQGHSSTPPIDSHDNKLVRPSEREKERGRAPDSLAAAGPRSTGHADRTRDERPGQSRSPRGDRGRLDERLGDRGRYDDRTNERAGRPSGHGHADGRATDRHPAAAGDSRASSIGDRQIGTHKVESVSSTSAAERYLEQRTELQKNASSRSSAQSTAAASSTRRDAANDNEAQDKDARQPRNVRDQPPPRTNGRASATEHRAPAADHSTPSTARGPSDRGSNGSVVKVGDHQMVLGDSEDRLANRKRRFADDSAQDAQPPQPMAAAKSAGAARGQDGRDSKHRRLDQAADHPRAGSSRGGSSDQWRSESSTRPRNDDLREKLQREQQESRRSESAQGPRGAGTAGTPDRAEKNARAPVGARPGHADQNWQRK